MNAHEWEEENERVGGRLFERIRRPAKPRMPNGSSARSGRSKRETRASIRNRNKISGQNGGMHHRRHRKVR